MKKNLSLFALALLGCMGMSQGTMTDKEKTDDTVNQETIKKHIYYLASDEMRGRDVGSQEIDQAADYLAEKLESYGAKPVPGADGFFQTVPLKQTAPPSRGILNLGDRSLEHGNDILILDGEDGELTCALPIW